MFLHSLNEVDCATIRLASLGVPLHQLQPGQALVWSRPHPSAKIDWPWRHSQPGLHQDGGNVLSLPRPNLQWLSCAFNHFINVLLSRRPEECPLGTKCQDEFWVQHRRLSRRLRSRRQGQKSLCRRSISVQEHQ